jgi:hypothetical protein
VSVPAGTKLTPPPRVVPPPPEAKQSIEVTVPAYPDTDQPLHLVWGCGGADVQPGTPKVVEINASCIENGKAELYAWAADTKRGGMVVSHVHEVAVGAFNLPAVKVTMPAWTTPATMANLTVESWPAGLSGTMGLYAFRGSTWIYNGTRDLVRQGNGNGLVTLFNMVPTIGTGWWRRTTIWRTDAGFDNSRTEGWFPVGYPLVPDQMFPYTVLMPIPDVTTSGTTASWTKVGDAETDRVILSVAASGTPAIVWRAYLPADATSFTFPGTPFELGEATKPGLGKVVVSGEDRGDIHSYAEALTKWPVEITPVASGNEWFYRRAYRIRP